MPTPKYATAKLLDDALQIGWGENGLTLRQQWRVNGVQRDDDYLALPAAGMSQIQFALSLPSKGSSTLAFFDGSSGVRPDIPGRGDAVSITTVINATVTQAVTAYCLQKTARPVG